MCDRAFERHLLFLWGHEDSYAHIVAAASWSWHIDPFVLRSLLEIESKMDPKAVNKKTGALGLAQFSQGGLYAVTTMQRSRGIKKRFTKQDALNPHKAIWAAAEYLAWFQRQSDIWGALEAYGTGKVRRKGKFSTQVMKHAERRRGRLKRNKGGEDRWGHKVRCLGAPAQPWSLVRAADQSFAGD